MTIARPELSRASYEGTAGRVVFGGEARRVRCPTEACRSGNLIAPLFEASGAGRRR